MSQGALALPVVGIVSGLTFSQDANAALAALLTKNSGGSAPTNAPSGSPVLGQDWLDTTSATLVKEKLYTGTAWIQTGLVDVTNSIWCPPMGGGTATVASASTTDIGADSRVAQTISGTTTITSFGSNAALSVGQHKILTFSGVLILTYSATALILPGNANITTAAGDVFEFQYLGTGNWRCTNYSPRTTTSPIGKGRIYSTRAAAAADSIPAAGTVDWVEVHGYAAVSDSPVALYVRVSAPGAPRSYHFQSADGAWWQFTGCRINPLCFGALDDDSTANTTIMQACLDYNNVQFGAIVEISGGSHSPSTYRTGLLTVNYDYVHIKMDDNVVLKWTTVGTGNSAITVSSSGSIKNYFTIEGGTLQGPAATCTMTVASPCVVTQVGHGLSVDSAVSFTTTGVLPGITSAPKIYFVKSVPTADTFTFTATYPSAGGAAFNSSGTNTGPHTLHKFVSNENGIGFVGTSSASRCQGLRVFNVNIYNFQGQAVYSKFATAIEIDHCSIYWCGYAGAQLLSQNATRFTRNHVYQIVPGASRNMYGVTITTDTSHYPGGSAPLDPNPGLPTATDPPCWNIFISENLIENVPWEGIDCHEGLAFYVGGNHVYGCQGAISIANGSNFGSPYGGYGNRVVNNYCDARNSDGTASGLELTGGGIAMDGGVATVDVASPIHGYGNICANNTVIYHGIASVTGNGAIEVKNSRQSLVIGNVIKNWDGIGVLISQFGGMVALNHFSGGVSGGDTTRTCIYDDSGSAMTGVKRAIIGNQCDISDGSVAPLYGYHEAGGVSPSTVRPMISDNDFAAASVASFSLFLAGFCLGNNLRPVLYHSSAGATVALAQIQGQDCDIVLTSGSTYSITAFSGYSYGQQVAIIQTGGGVATIVRDGSGIKTFGAASIGLNNTGSVVLGRFDNAGFQQLAVAGRST